MKQRGTMKRQLILKNKIGVTLVELIVVMAIVAVISVIGIRMFQSVNHTQSELSYKILLQMEARKAFSQLSDKIRESTTVLRPTIGESLSFLVVKDITNNSVVYYLEPNNLKSKLYKQKVYKLVMYLCDYSGKYNKSNEHVILVLCHD